MMPRACFFVPFFLLSVKSCGLCLMPLVCLQKTLYVSCHMCDKVLYCSLYFVHMYAVHYVCCALCALYVPYAHEACDVHCVLYVLCFGCLRAAEMGTR